MAQVKNLSKDIITTITAGNINPQETKMVADWEVDIIKILHTKVEVVEKPVVQPKTKKKGKK